MTPEQLQELVFKGDATRVAEALNPLDERARRALAQKAFDLFKASIDYNRQSELARSLWAHGHPAAAVVPIALLACCDATKARRVEHAHDPKIQEAMLGVLLARKPAWIDAWLAHRLDDEFVPPAFWDVVRGLVRAGVAQRPASPGYIALMVTGLQARVWEKRKPFAPVSQLLLEDPALLEWEVWRLFEVQHRAFDKDWFDGQANTPQGYETWTQALLKLCAQGRIERTKLIDAVLSGLASGLRPVSLGAFIRFADAMEITNGSCAGASSRSANSSRTRPGRSFPSEPTASRGWRGRDSWIAMHFSAAWARP
jgi:hypothetical protein